MNVKNLPIINSLFIIRLITKENNILSLFMIVCYLIISKIIYKVIFKNDTSNTR